MKNYYNKYKCYDELDFMCHNATKEEWKEFNKTKQYTKDYWKIIKKVEERMKEEYEKLQAIERGF